MQITGNNYFVFKSQGLSAIVCSLCMMVNQLYLAGLMERLEPSCLNLVNYCMLLMMLIIMDVLLLLLHLMVKELSLEELRDKLEFGELQNKLKLWRPLWKSIEDKYGQYKLINKILKLLVQVVMDLASSGILKIIQEYYVYFSQLHLNKLP